MLFNVKPLVKKFKSELNKKLSALKHIGLELRNIKKTVIIYGKVIAFYFTSLLVWHIVVTKTEEVFTANIYDLRGLFERELRRERDFIHLRLPKVTIDTDGADLLQKYCRK